jgi:hypothetical protein
MEPKELMEKLYGQGAPYPGMDVEWECFAGDGTLGSGMYRGKITRITWCQHCALPTIEVESSEGARFSVRISQDGRFVCGIEAPE